MVLAAGEGSRLRPLTETCPKPMLPVGGMPILERNLRLLSRWGVTEAAVNLHHCGESITQYFQAGAKLGMNLTYSFEDVLLGTAGALVPLKNYFDRSFFVIYGDNMSNCNLMKMADLHVRTRAICTVALFEREDVQASGVAVTDATGRIRGFVEKPDAGTEPSHWVSAGILCCQPEMLRYVPDVQPSDFGRDVLPALMNTDHIVSGYFMSEQLLWIDSKRDYDRTQDLIMRNDPRTQFLSE